MNEKIKQERLARLREEYERLTREGLALIDACKFYDVEEIDNQRREIMKRIDELEARISATDRSWANTW
jgi:hypothetical protein